jgi:hypothetical protein
MARSVGAKAVAERMVRAEEEFIGTLMSTGGLDREAAERVLSYYRKHKIVRMDAVNARMSVTHGMFLDRDVIQRATTL